MAPDKQSVKRIKEILSRVKNIRDSQARAEFLDQACVNDISLRKEVESLLEAFDITNDFLSHDASGGSLMDFPDLVGSMIGGYRLVERIGEGGFGEVYRAEQTEPFRREVALKIIKLGMDTKNVVARFEAERQALARMNHPGIAQVYDAGATETGRPYFVMELVDGIPIIDYCDRHRLSMPDRIELFRQVCGAVQHAHQKGILHRDLKPSNILVREENGKPLPKVIDFGVAKSLEGRLTEQTLATLQEMLIGTPMYMSPEQLSRDTSDIDTRSDIYSLGIILYELVAGTTPLNHKTPTSLTMAGMRQALETEELPRPSRRFKALGRKTAVIADARQVKPPTLERLLRGDLDWVVMKAIEKERDRRYGGIEALAQDLERYLNHEPVSAGPPSLGYRTKKFMRRHRMASAVIVSVSLALLFGACVATIGFLRASHAAGRARRQELRATAAAERAQQQELRATTEAERARQQELRASEEAGKARVQERLAAEQADKARQQELRATEEADKARQQELRATEEADKARQQELRAKEEAERARQQEAIAEAAFAFICNDMISGIDPRRKSDRDIKLRTVVDQAEGRIDERFKNQPLVCSRLHRLLSEIYLNLGEREKALMHAEKSLNLAEQERDQGHPEYLEAGENLAVMYRKNGQYEEVESLSLDMLEVQEKTYGPNHLQVAKSLNNLAELYMERGEYAKAEPLFKRALEIRENKLGENRPLVAQSLSNLARLYENQGRAVEAEPLSMRALAIEQNLNLGNLAETYMKQGQYEKAEPLFKQSLKIREETFGKEHQSITPCLDGLAKICEIQKRYDEAESLFKHELVIQERQFGPEHPEVAMCLTSLARLYESQDRFEKSEPLLERALAIREKTLGPDHPLTATSMASLAKVYMHEGRYSKAEPLLKQTLEIREKTLGPDHPHVAVCLYLMASLYADQGNYKEAEKLYKQTTEIREQSRGPNHPAVAQSLYSLAVLYRNMGRDREAEQLTQRANEIMAASK